MLTTVVVSFVHLTTFGKGYQDLARGSVAPVAGGTMYLALLILLGVAVPSAMAIFCVYLLGRRFGASRVVVIGPVLLLLAMVPLFIIEVSFRRASVFIPYGIGQILAGLFLSRSFPRL
ncbi:hypothetical protein Drose_26095 [Dactylosporangium roseum]|uniref:Uncharacterized protein n=1 Tax=Dactylosporangium roseum TaxID=47989 RepID=A0ABY5YY56_9ACTN|nr:hypothetical protein [Dactylosporangium roseum]UWZ34676.1 hypothetical protein Drose_26095 [Dactylosporangium roseum]